MRMRLLATTCTIIPALLVLLNTISPTVSAFGMASNINNDAPLCNCNQPACKRTVRKEGPNQGRLFWGCGQWSATDKDKGCRFFEWIPEASETSQDQQQTTSGHPVKIFTFNVAGFKPHHFAPTEFDPQQCLAEKIDQIKPEIMALQELPNPYFNHPGYYTVGTARSHCGYVALLAKNGLSWTTNSNSNSNSNQEENIENNPILRNRPLSSTTFPPDMMAAEVPFVVGSLDIPNKPPFFVISCHLEPYGEGASTRLDQIKALTKTLPTNAIAVLAGDMNVRNKEGPDIESLQWQDAWKQAGSVRRHEYTWNSKINHYHGKEGFQFMCRFDRVYLRNVQKVESFRLVANGALPNDDVNECYYLSDHFGILTTVVV